MLARDTIPSMLITGIISERFDGQLISKRTTQLSLKFLHSLSSCLMVVEMPLPHFNTQILMDSCSGSCAPHPLTTGIVRRQCPSLKTPRDIAMGVAREMALASSPTVFALKMQNTSIHSYDCPSDSDITLKAMGKIKTEGKPACIFLGLFNISTLYPTSWTSTSQNLKVYFIEACWCIHALLNGVINGSGLNRYWSVTNDNLRNKVQSNGNLNEKISFKDASAKYMQFYSGLDMWYSYRPMRFCRPRK